MMPSSPLDDPATSAHAWRRYKRLMKGMAAHTTTVLVATLELLEILDEHDGLACEPQRCSRRSRNGYAEAGF